MYQLLDEVAGLLAGGVSITKASDLVGIPVPDRLPVDFPFTPSPEMIRQHCFAIQSTWTATEWRSRSAVDCAPVETQVVSLRSLGLDTP